MLSSLPPGPRMPRPLQTVGWWTRPIAFLEHCRAQHGKRFTLRLLTQPPFVMVSDPDEIREVFTAPPDALHPGEGARILEPVVGRHSVILLDEGAHLEQRKLMLPAFHGERMERLAALLAEVTEREVAAWPRDEALALHPRLQALTLEVILRAVFGLAAGERLDALRAQLTEMLEIAARPGALLPDVARELVSRGSGARFDALQAQADALLFELIAERRAAADTEGDDVLAMLLGATHEDGTPMSEQELRDELMTLLVAGHETTASALAWGFERLAREPAAVAALSAELGGPDADAYLTAAVHEILRCRPVLPNAAPRLVMRPYTVGGWDYEPGVCLAANAYLVHHDADVYDEPYAFRLERFLGQAPGTYTWIPFGGGRRRCLGASFATLEMKVVLRAVLASCELGPATARHERARRRSITISPRAGARTVLRARRPVPAGAAA